MAKGSRGGRRAVATGGGSNSPFIMPQATPQQAQQILQDLLNGDTVSFDSFMSLSDDEKADAISTILKQDLPNFLDDSAMQRLLYYTEVDGKPSIVSDKSLDSVAGPDLYRTISNTYDRKTDVNYTAKQIYNQIVKGDYTRVSSTGGSAYGKGIYFADSYRGSTVYGNSNSLVMRAKLNSNARVVSYRNAVNGAGAEIRSGSKLGRVLNRMSGHDATSVWALAKGYNVVQDNNSGYHVVLDRSALSVSDRTKSATGYSW